jgi:hypothetical protein
MPVKTVSTPTARSKPAVDVKPAVDQKPAPPAADAVAAHEGLGSKLKHLLHVAPHAPPPKSPQLVQLENVVKSGAKLSSAELLALAGPLAELEPADIRRLNELMVPTLMPWDRGDAHALLSRLAERSGLPASDADAAATKARESHHDFRRVDGPVQVTLDRVLAGEKLTPGEFGKWLDGYLASSASDRRNVALQLFHHLGLHPAKQEEVAREVARRAGLPEDLAANVPHYQAGQDLTVVASLAYRFGLPLVTVGVSAGIGAMIKEKNLVTGEHKPVAVSPVGISAGVVQGRIMESVENGHLKTRLGAIATSPLAIGIGAGHDPIFGPVISARLSPLTNFFVGEGSVGARVPIIGGLISGTGVALSMAVREPRLEAMTDHVAHAAHLAGAELHEVGEFLKRVFHGNDKAPVVGLAEEPATAT